MDSMAMEKVRLRDIFAGLKDIFGSESIKDEQNQDKKLQRIYDIENEIGSTKSIASLEKSLTEYSTEKKKGIARVKTKGVSGKNNIQEVIEELVEENER